jgi:hypothetical protein
MSENKILCVRADFERATHILSSFIKTYFIDEATKNCKVEDLNGAYATRLNFQNKLKDQTIKGILIGGHGDYTLVTGQNYDVLWVTGMNLEQEVKDRDIVTISCRCGRDLGKYLMASGAKTYKGYREEFILMCGNTEPPSDDYYGKLFLTPALTRAKYLYIPTITPEECEDEANKITMQNISYWKNMNPQVADLLKYDMDIQVFYKQNSKWEKPKETIWQKLWKWFTYYVLKFISNWLNG